MDETTNEDLYEKQMKTLKTFLETGAISKAQYDKSASVLKAKFMHEGED